MGRILSPEMEKAVMQTKKKKWKKESRFGNPLKNYKDLKDGVKKSHDNFLID